MKPGLTVTVLPVASESNCGSQNNRRSISIPPDILLEKSSDQKGCFSGRKVGFWEVKFRSV